MHGLLVHLSGSVEILRDHHRVVPPLRFRIELVSVLLVVVARTGFDALGPQCLEQRSQRSSGLLLVDENYVGGPVDALRIRACVGVGNPRQLGYPFVQPAKLGVDHRAVLCDLRQLPARYGGGQRMDAQLGPHAGALIHAIGAILWERLRQFVVAKRGGAFVVFAGLVHPQPALDGRQDLAALKAEDADRSPRPYGLAFYRRATRLRGVFEHDQPALLGEVADLIHVARVPKRVHG